MMMMMMTMMSGWGPGGSDGPVGGNPTFRRCLANTRPIRPLHSRDHNDRRHHLPHKIINTNPRHCYKIAVWPGWKLMNFIEGYFLFFNTFLNFCLVILTIFIIITTSRDHHISSGMNIWPVNPKSFVPPQVFELLVVCWWHSSATLVGAGKNSSSLHHEISKIVILHRLRKHEFTNNRTGHSCQIQEFPLSNLSSEKCLFLQPAFFWSVRSNSIFDCMKH